MGGLRPLKTREVIRALEKLGFQQISQKGSHAKFSHPDGRKIIVPIHAGTLIGRGLLKQILRQAGMDWDAFQEYL